jgi:hypothetical protein
MNNDLSHLPCPFRPLPSASARMQPSCAKDHISMSDCPSPLQHRLQVTFQSENEEAYAALERLIGCARRTGVALMSFRVTRHGENCHGYLRVGAEHRDPIDLLSNRLAMLIGLDELMCCHEPIHAGSSHKAASKKRSPCPRDRFTC